MGDTPDGVRRNPIRVRSTEEVEAMLQAWLVDLMARHRLNPHSEELRAALREAFISGLSGDAATCAFREDGLRWLCEACTSGHRIHDRFVYCDRDAERRKCEHCGQPAVAYLVWAP